jgi:hypothetical protein
MQSSPSSVLTRDTKRYPMNPWKNATKKPEYHPFVKRISIKRLGLHVGDSGIADATSYE